MFRGEFNHNIDTKGRLSVPARFRDSLGDTCIVTKGLEHCLYVYSMEEWQNIEDKFREVPRTATKVRQFQRFFFGSACDCEIDKQGRILIQSSLREYAGLDKECVLTGVFNRIEIWNKAELEMENNIDDKEAMIEEISALGIEI